MMKDNALFSSLDLMLLNVKCPILQYSIGSLSHEACSASQSHAQVAGEGPKPFQTIPSAQSHAVPDDSRLDISPVTRGCMH